MSEERISAEELSYRVARRSALPSGRRSPFDKYGESKSLGGCNVSEWLDYQRMTGNKNPMESLRRLINE